MNVLWLRPTTGDNISVGRERIANQLEKKGVNVTILDSTGADALGATRAALFGDYDVIVGTARAGLYIGYPLSLLSRSGFVADVADPIDQIADLPNLLFKFFCRYELEVLRRTTHRAVVYESSRQRLADQGISSTPVENGVDFDQFANPDPNVVQHTKSLLSKAGVDLRSPIAIYVGGLSTTYYLFDILEASRRCPDWQFVFLGEGPLEQELQAASERYNNVFYLGSFAYKLMPGFMSHALAGFCLVAIEQPLKVLEYGAAGLATIGMYGGLSDRFSDDQLLFIKPSPKTIVEALEALQTNEGLVRQYSKNLQEEAKRHSWSDIAKIYYDLLKKAK